MTSSGKTRQFTHLKNSVIELRKKGKTYSEIREVFPVPKATLSDWLKNLELSENTKQLLKKRAYERWRINQEANIKKRISDALQIRLKFENKAKKEIQKIGKKDLKLIGSALYWAEGNTKNRNFLRFANSKAEIIETMMRFFRDICNIPNEKIKARIHIYSGMDYRKTLDFWTKTTKLPKQNFYKPQTQISKASKRKRKLDTLPFGTLHLTAGNTEITCRVKGWIRGISEKI